MAHYISPLSFGQKVKATEDYAKGFYSGIVGTVVGTIKDGEKFKVEFFLTRSRTRVVKIVPLIFLRGVGNEPYKT